jgi:hypothetical protein
MVVPENRQARRQSMNPWGLIIIGMGLIILIIGFKGSQHNVIAAFKGAKQTGSVAKTGKVH